MFSGQIFDAVFSDMDWNVYFVRLSKGLYFC